MVVLRALLIVVGTLAGGFGLHVLICRTFGIVGREPWMTISFLGSMALTALASVRATRRLAPKTELILTPADFEQRGLAQRESYEGRRAFKVEEFEDEGPHFFIELADGRVLYLSGQYLYDVQNFPCRNFELLRDKEHGWVMCVEPKSAGLLLDAALPAYRARDFERGVVPGDGDILTRKYGDILNEFTNRNRPG